MSDLGRPEIGTVGVSGFDRMRDPADAVVDWDGKPISSLDVAHHEMYKTTMFGGLKPQKERRKDKWPQKGSE